MARGKAGKECYPSQENCPKQPDFPPIQLQDFFHSFHKNMCICVLYFQLHHYSRLVPKSGVWENTELNIQIDFSSSTSNRTFVFWNGTTIHCDVGQPPRSARLLIYSVERVEGVCTMGEYLYAFSCKKLTKNELTVVDEDSGNKYVFYRISEKE